jgi:hypothetical protein
MHLRHLVPHRENPAGLTMTAQFIQIGEPAHDAERQALRFLVEGLPDRFTVYGNAWLVERSGVVYELDAVAASGEAIALVPARPVRRWRRLRRAWQPGSDHARGGPCGANVVALREPRDHGNDGGWAGVLHDGNLRGEERERAGAYLKLLRAAAGVNCSGRASC